MSGDDVLMSGPEEPISDAVRDNLDIIFGTDTESEGDNVSEKASEVDVLNETFADELSEDEEDQKEVLKASIFGDDDESEDDRKMKIDEEKKRSKNVLSRKELTLDPNVDFDDKCSPAILKLPGFISVEEQQFSIDKLEDEELPLLDVDELGNYPHDGLLKLSVSMRWRKNPMTEACESNSRLIKWSDGSMTLQIGAEQFEVMSQKTHKEQAYLYNRHAKDGCMEGVAKLSERLAVRPFVTGSANHRKFFSLNSSLTTSNQVGKEGARVKLAVTTADPEREKQRMIKLEQEKIKSRRKVEARRRNLQQRSYERVAKTGLSARFLEEEEIGNGEDEDRYEDDFIDDTENVAEGSDDLEEEDSEEDTDYKSGDDVDESEDEEAGKDSDEESTAQESEASGSDSEHRKRKTSKKTSTSSRKAAKIIESDEE